ncbi:MAG: RHS repeat-associated core domain-containing protein, partial [Cyclobacteriaceae bacterium]
ERLEDFDLSLDFTLYRTYDPQLNRWLQIDPKTSERESPYVGFGNAPVKYMDPLGDTIQFGRCQVVFWNTDMGARPYTEGRSSSRYHWRLGGAK